MNNLYLLQLFADGGDGGAEGSAAVDSPTTAEGSVETTTEETPPAQETRDFNAEFNDLIKGEYKEAYQSRIKDAVGKRLKGTEDIVKKYKGLEASLTLLGQRYNVDPSDSAALSKAIEADNSYYEHEAMELGVPVEQLRQLKQAEAQNIVLQKQLQENEAKQKADQLYSQWMQESESLKQIYPGFDLDNLLNETENNSPEAQQFRSLLGTPGVTMRQAYEIANLDNIIGGAMQHTAEVIEKKVVNSVIANKSRPAENGLGSSPTAPTARDISSLTDAERAEMIRRAEAGEQIDLKTRF